MVSRAAAAGLIRMFDEVAVASPALAKSMVMELATRCERLVNVIRPFTAVKLTTPCKTPLPPFREATTAVVLSDGRKLPICSSIGMSGGGAKPTPAVAVGEGWV